MLPDDRETVIDHETSGDRLTAGLAGGAVIGGMIGLVVPGLGSVLGSIVGGALGTGAALIAKSKG